MLFIGDECAFVAITVGIEILALASSLSVDVVAQVLITVGVDRMSLSSIISG